MASSCYRALVRLVCIILSRLPASPCLSSALTHLMHSTHTLPLLSIPSYPFAPHPPQFQDSQSYHLPATLKNGIFYLLVPRLNICTRKNFGMYNICIVCVYAHYTWHRVGIHGISHRSIEKESLISGRKGRGRYGGKQGRGEQG